MPSTASLPPASVYRRTDALVSAIPPDRRLRNAVALLALGILVGAGGVLLIEHPAGGTVPVARTPREVAHEPARLELAVASRPRTSDRLDRAREAALRGEPATVRQLLEARVRSGHGTAEEANLVRQACKMMGDRECVVDMDVKYPRWFSVP
jgi:hypothetical protein